MRTQTERITGFEVSQQLEAEKKTILERAIPEERQWIGFIGGLIAMFIVFLAAIWLAGNPFDATWRSASSTYNQVHGLVGTNSWHIIWYVVLLGLIFEFMDASAGMGFGTVMSPILMILGFTPLQVVPTIMIQQAACGLIGTFLHQEFQNVEWKFRPMSETIKLWLMIAGLGCAAVLFSITAVYAYLHMAKIWIKLYVTLLMLLMGLVAIYQAKTRGTRRPYRFKRMAVFAFLAGFNKGIGGGGYGPVVTVGGLISGIPVKAQLAVTAISEGTVSTFAAIVWFALLAQGMKIDFILFPSMMIAAIGSGILAPYATRVFPQKLWNWVIPIYCLVCVGICFWKIGPQLFRAMGL
ncbi:MAG: sulfite exporter TauE/SafE family protein [Desulfobacterales bacterium]|nr:sulfite exporter TauE/SafE family protein [Desulfobacterales bacterium]